MATPAAQSRTLLVAEPGITIFDEIKENGRILRFLSLDADGAGNVQGAKDLGRPDFHVHQYSQHFVYAAVMAAPLLNPASLLILGLGAGVSVHDVARRFPSMQVHVVDINHALFEHTHRHFYPLDLPNMCLFSRDARAHVVNSNNRYDVVFCDIFGPSLAVPPYLLADDFYREIRNAGTRMLVVNSHAHLAKSLYELLTRHFDHVQSIAGNNTFLIASDVPLRRDFSVEEIDSLQSANIDAARIQNCAVYMSSSRVTPS
jgi:spermidine synthase